MKKCKWMVSVVLLLFLCLLALPVFAGTSTEGGRSGGSGELNSLPPFKFEKHKYGIGYGNCPVYSAPSESAYRAANGKASCQTTNYQVDDAGFVDGWLLVRYQVKDGWRVGYIPPRYVRDFRSSMAPHFGWVSCTANESIYVTDNPYSHSSSIAMLSAGEQFHVISQYNYYASEGYDWWYIECDVDGQVARGFIEKSANFSVD